MKIAVIGDPNGIHLKKRLRALCKEGVEIMIVPVLPCACLEFPNITIFPPPIGQRFFRQQMIYASFFRKSSFDAIYVFSASDPIGWIASIFSSAPLIVATIGCDVFFEQLPEISLISKLNMKGVRKIASRVTVLSSYMRQQLLREGVSDARISQDYWGVDPLWFEPVNVADAKKELGLEKAWPIIFSCRLMRELYQIEAIVEAAALLRKDYPQLSVIFSQYKTDPAYLKKIHKLIQKKNLQDAIMFLPEETDDQLFQKIYALSDVVVMVPLSDGMPSSLIEAWTSQTPVVVSDIPHYETSWHENLLLKSATDPKSLAASLKRVLQDKGFSRNLIKSGFAYASKHYKGFSAGGVLSGLAPRRFLLAKRFVALSLFLGYCLEAYFWEFVRRCKR